MNYIHAGREKEAMLGLLVNKTIEIELRRPSELHLVVFVHFLPWTHPHCLALHCTVLCMTIERKVLRCIAM